MNRQDAKDMEKTILNRQGAKAPKCLMWLTWFELRTYGLATPQQQRVQPKPLTRFSWRLGALAVQNFFLGELGILAVHKK